jgi:heterodisulfide reductase subunit A2
MRIFVLYRDMRTYGFRGCLYRSTPARRDLRALRGTKPAARTASGDRVTCLFDDPILGRALEVDADCLGLSTGLMADDETTEDLAAIFH